MRYDTYMDILVMEAGELLYAFSHYSEVLRRCSGASRTRELTDVLEQRLLSVDARISVVRDIVKGTGHPPEMSENRFFDRLVDSIMEIASGEGRPGVRDAALMGAVLRIECVMLASSLLVRGYAVSSGTAVAPGEFEKIIDDINSSISKLDDLARNGHFVSGPCPGEGTQDR